MYPSTFGRGSRQVGPMRRLHLAKLQLEAASAPQIEVLRKIQKKRSKILPSKMSALLNISSCWLDLVKARKKNEPNKSLNAGGRIAVSVG